MKVYIFTEGGYDIGLGHVTRCLSAAQAFEEKDISPVFVVNGDESAAGLLEGRQFRLRDWLEDRQAVLNELAGADIAIVDSYLADKAFYEGVSAAVKKAVFIDDNMRLDYPAGMVVNGAVGAEDMRYPRGGKVEYLLGSKYALIRSEFLDVPERPVAAAISSIMVTFGGDDTRDMTPKVTEFLKKEFPDKVKKVVIGAGFREKGRNEALEDGKTELIHFPSAAGMKEIMLSSDIAVSAGGQTLLELARTGLPAVVVGVADNQAANIRAWERAGSVVSAGVWNRPDLEKHLARHIRALEAQGVRRNMSLSGRSTVDGFGPRRVAAKAVSAALEASYVQPVPGNDAARPVEIGIRPAGEDDCRDIWAWRSSPEVSGWCFSGGDLTLDQHKEWFARKSADPNVRMYIAEAKGGVKVGQARLEASGASATISVNLNPEYIGRGIGTKLIVMATQKFFAEMPSVRETLAEIKENNTASIKAFEKAGYVFYKSPENGRKAVVYRMERTDE